MTERFTDGFLDSDHLAVGAVALGGRPPVPSAATPASPGPLASPATASASRAGSREGEALIKRTYTIRPDQSAALALALNRQALGEEAAHGADRSEIVRVLLDLHGYNAEYVRGETPLR